MAMLAVYAKFGLTFGQFTIHYIVPLFVFATWLVVTTFLHHQVCMLCFRTNKRNAKIFLVHTLKNLKIGAAYFSLSK